MELNDIIAARIVCARGDKGWSQQYLGDVIGVSQSSIQSYECGRRRPPVEKIEKMADALGVPVSYLVGIDDSKEPTQMVRLDETESRLVELFRECDGDGRGHLMACARAFSAASK